MLRNELIYLCKFMATITTWVNNYTLVVVIGYDVSVFLKGIKGKLVDTHRAAKKC